MRILKAAKQNQKFPFHFLSAPPTPPAEEKKKGKENFWVLAPGTEGGGRGAPARAERRGFVGGKSVGRASRGHGKNWRCCRKSDCGGIIQLCSNIF